MMSTYTASRAPLSANFRRERVLPRTTVVCNNVDGVDCCDPAPACDADEKRHDAPRTERQAPGAFKQGSALTTPGGKGVESAALALEMRNITMSFPGVLALDDVSFGCARGEVHALCGENGAGKSTLIKILGGVYQPDAGAIWIDGRGVTFSHPVAARKAGISIIHQELSLLPYRTVAENIFLGIEPTRYGVLDRRRMRVEFLAAAPPPRLVDRAGGARGRLVDRAAADRRNRQGVRDRGAHSRDGRADRRARTRRRLAPARPRAPPELGGRVDRLHLP